MHPFTLTNSSEGPVNPVWTTGEGTSRERANLPFVRLTTAPSFHPANMRITVINWGCAQQSSSASVLEGRNWKEETRKNKWIFQVKMKIIKLWEVICSLRVSKNESDEWGRDSQHSHVLRPIPDQSNARSLALTIYSFIWQISVSESDLVASSKNTDVVLGNHVTWQ